MALFVRLTAPNGKFVWVAKAWVERVRYPVESEAGSGVGAAVDLSSGVQYVMEDPIDVMTQLEG